MEVYMPRDDERTCIDLNRARYLIKHYILLYQFALRNSDNEHITERAIDILSFLEGRKNFPRLVTQLAGRDGYVVSPTGEKVRLQKNCWMRLAILEARRRLNVEE